MEEISVSISGMTCSTCAKAIESKLQNLVGVSSANVNLLAESAVVRYQPKVISKLQVASAINSLGFKAEICTNYSSPRPNSDLFFCLLFAIPEFFICMIFPYVPWLHNMLNLGLVGKARLRDILEFLLTTPIQYTMGKNLFVKSKAMAREKVYTMDLLILIATTVAYAYSTVMLAFALFSVSFAVTFFETSTTLLTFLVISKRIEHKTKKKTNKILNAIVRSRAKKARLLKPTRPGAEVLVDIEAIQVDDMLKIMPGESVPVDGIITDGQSKLNESLISGESKPRTKRIGDVVYAGALNLNSPFIIKSTAKAKDSFIDRMLAIIQNSQSLKTAIQLDADYIATFFIPGVLFLSAATFVGWIVAFSTYSPQELGFANDIPALCLALRFSIAVLAVACPCSLTLAVPTANAVGIGIGAEKGLLIKGGQVFEDAVKVEYAVFDKTGTLTTGQMCLSHFQLSLQISNSLVIALLYAIEKESEHYSASIICTYLEKISPLSLESLRPQLALKSYQREPGCGIAGRFLVGQDENELRAGRISWILETSKDNQYFREHYLDIESALCAGNTVIGLSLDGLFCGFIVLTDQVKQDAECCIGRVKQMHLIPAMLSGDSLKTVRYVANQLGITMYFGELSPVAKAAIIKNLQTKAKVAMIGDGLNDSPALSQADLGIAVCNGTDLALECADVILVANGLWRIPFLFALAKVVGRTVLINFLISFCYNLIMLPLASGLLFTRTGLTLHPWMCAVTMALSSISVVLSSAAMRFNRSIRKFLAYK